MDESREQTRAIHRLQREKRTLEGSSPGAKSERLLKVHQNAQRLLRPLAVRNPYADALTFPDGRTRSRRDHEKYLTLIDTIALLHQHQREIKTRRTRRRAHRVRGGDARRYRGRQRAWRTRRWAARSMSSRRRPGGCWSW